MLTESELIRLVHELEVHQIELEMINAELVKQCDEKGKLASELLITNKELLYQNSQKEKYAKELSLLQQRYRMKFDDGTINSHFGNELPHQEDDGSVISHGLTPDISIPLAMEESLLQKDADFRNVVENSPMPNVIHRNGTILYANPAYLQMICVEKIEDVLGTFILDWVHPDYQETVKLRTGKVLEEGTTAPRTEIQFVRSDGTVGYSEVQSTPVMYGGSWAVHTALNDISESKRVFDLLKQSEERFRIVVEQSPNANIIHQHGIINYANPATFRLLGVVNETDILGTSILSWIQPDFHAAVISRLNAVDNNVASFSTFEVSLYRMDKTLIEVEATNSLIINQGVPSVHAVLVDITERKRHERLLPISEARNSSMISNISEVIGIMGVDGLMKYKSSNIEKWFGWLPEDLIGNSGFFTTHPDDLDYVQKSLLRLMENEGSVITIEFRHSCKDGSYKPIELTACNLISDPNINGLLLNYRDISDRKKIEDELRKNNNRYVSMTSNNSDVIAIIGTDGTLLYQSPNVERLFGWLPDDQLGTNSLLRIHPDEIQRIKLEFASLLEEDKLKITVDLRYQCKDGTYKQIELTATNLINDPDIEGVLLNYHDVTLRKQTEEELKESSTRLELATRAGGVGVWDFDLVNNTLLWDDQMYLLYNVNKSDFKSDYEAWRKGVHPDDKAGSDEAFQMAVSGIKEFDTEFRVIWPDGSVRNIRALATLQYDHYGRPIRLIGTNWDITEQKRIEAVLLKATNDAEAANKSKSIFLANMSHEIRTPLNAIIGFSQLMNREKLTESQKEYIISIHRSGEHLLTLINDILELSKMEAGRVVLNPTNVDLNAFLGDMQRMFAGQAQAKQLQLIFETPAGESQYILVDDSKLRQILINLIGNAIKFTDQGGVAVRARVDRKEDSESILMIEIQDSGTGISESELKLLFRHFEQASAGIRQRSGTGLGLALSRELAILMGGDITVSSELNKGSVFRFHVDIKEGNKEVYTPKTVRRVLCIDNPKNTYRILVVDDIRENRKLVVDLLSLSGFETREAVNGEDAIALFDHWDPHLILMDLRMPVMDGYDAIRRIKGSLKGEGTPIIVLSASEFKEDKSNLFAADIHGFIRKPFRENELFELIGKVLSLKFIYKEDVQIPEAYLNLNTIESVSGELSKLPQSLIVQMRDALEGGDFYLLIDLVRAIEPGNPHLAEQLRFYANNFDYDYLHQIIK